MPLEATPNLYFNFSFIIHDALWWCHHPDILLYAHNWRMAKRFFMKFGMDIMPIKAFISTNKLSGSQNKYENEQIRIQNIQKTHSHRHYTWQFMPSGRT
jgi:hypothetical protein